MQEFFRDFSPELSPKIKGLSFSYCQFVLITIILMEMTTQGMFFALLSDLCISPGLSFHYHQ